MQISGRSIGRDARPFVVAELSGNHGGSLERALALVEAAAAAGVHAVKLQTYTADTMTLDLHEGEFFIGDTANAWAGRSLHDLYREASTPWEWHAPLFARCYELGVIPFSSPFDESAVDFLETLDCPAYKIAAFENTDLPLIRHAAATGKPLVISTGMATTAELDEAVRAAREAGCTQLALLKCTSAYPADPDDAHLHTMPHLRALFDCEVGVSDHSLGMAVAIASVALGGTLIEKHFTLARADGGVDAAFSMEPAEMMQLVAESERAWRALGTVRYGAGEREAPSLKHRRSLYITQDLKAGDRLTRENLRRIRPGNGLAPKFFEEVLGRRVHQDVQRGTPLSWALLMD
jgi:pseudaminic acid synthase